jgi:ABC-type amino acid transport substrate-binding protein
MKFYKLFSFLSLFLFACKQQKTEQLIVGVSPDYPPFAFIEKGQTVGLDIDLVNELARRLNKHVEFRTMEFDLILPELQMGNLQMVIGGMTSTPERAERIFFTEPYLTSGELVMLSKNNLQVQNLADLKNYNVVVNEGYVADSYITKNGIEPLRVASVADALFLLEVGQADVFVSSKIALTYFLKNLSGYKTSTIAGIDDESSLAISKLYPELANQLDAELIKMKTDGTLNAIFKKWSIL